MKDLVFTDGKKAYTTTLIIAEGCEIEHRSVMRLLQRHSNTETLSGFEIHKVSRGGRPVEYATLDEKQTTFLITLMRNSDVVVAFKERLTNAFFEQRRIISNLIQQSGNPDWQNVRKDGKIVYKQKTEVIKLFVEYATNQGSRNARMYYANLSKMENSALFFIEQKYKNLRDVLTIKQLMQISTADDVIEKALMEGMAKGLHYRDCYKLAKERIEAFASIIGKSPVLALDILQEPEQHRPTSLT
jgi:hypothetical protein